MASSVETRPELKEIKEGSEELVEEAIADLFNSAKLSVIMSTSLHTGFYNEDRVHHSLEDAARRVESFRILLDNDVDVEASKRELAWLFELKANGRLELAKSNQSIPHWMVVDERSIRMEKPHPRGERGSSNLIIKNADANLLPLIDDIVTTLERLWEQATPV